MEGPKISASVGLPGTKSGRRWLFQDQGCAGKRGRDGAMVPEAAVLLRLSNPTDEQALWPLWKRTYNTP